MVLTKCHTTKRRVTYFEDFEQSRLVLQAHSVRKYSIGLAILQGFCAMFLEVAFGCSVWHST